jgi:putative addiction module component (TIGR02574 family)
MNADILDQARSLSVSDQLELIEALWAEISAREATPLPTPAQQAELERRLDDLERYPDDVKAWADANAEIVASLKRQ